MNLNRKLLSKKISNLNLKYKNKPKFFYQIIHRGFQPYIKKRIVNAKLYKLVFILLSSYLIF